MKNNPLNHTGENYLNYILNQLSELENITFRKMIGGIGFFWEGLMFGAIIGGKLRFRVPASCADDCGAASYLFEEWARQSCEVPAAAIEDKSELKKWAEEAIALIRGERQGKRI